MGKERPGPARAVSLFLLGKFFGQFILTRKARNNYKRLALFTNFPGLCWALILPEKNNIKNNFNINI